MASKSANYLGPKIPLDLSSGGFCLILVFVISMALPIQGFTDTTNIISLTQTGCQFLEPEGIDLGYKTKNASDCEKQNTLTAPARLKKSKPLVLAAGKYVFKVTNKNVPYTLGFYLRGKGLSRVILPSVSGGGITTGTTQDYVIELKPGAYVYSCPLNPTPDYPLIVK
jgi:hypothetical protein